MAVETGPVHIITLTHTHSSPLARLYEAQHVATQLVKALNVVM